MEEARLYPEQFKGVTRSNGLKLSRVSGETSWREICGGWTPALAGRGGPAAWDHGLWLQQVWEARFIPPGPARLIHIRDYFSEATIAMALLS